jgi:hypothetical protein
MADQQSGMGGIMKLMIVNTVYGKISNHGGEKYQKW